MIAFRKNPNSVQIFFESPAESVSDCGLNLELEFN